MERKHNSKIVSFAKELRKNMTKEERHLWYDFLRYYHEKFTRQKVLGKYIADFYCHKAKLVIEIDGSQHFTKIGKLKDEFRTENLEKFGLKIIRFSNHQIDTRFRAVCNYIDETVKASIQENTDQNSPPPILKTQE